jgi:hypothetical protein
VDRHWGWDPDLYPVAEFIDTWQGDKVNSGLGLSYRNARLYMASTSNGKSSIVEERLYSFFFNFFQKKNEASFFRFSSFTQLGTKTYVLLRSCKIFKRFTSFCFVFQNFWNNPIRFCFNLQKFRNRQFVLLLILLYFGLNSFLLRS